MGWRRNGEERESRPAGSSGGLEEFFLRNQAPSRAPPPSIFAPTAGAGRPGPVDRGAAPHPGHPRRGRRNPGRRLSCGKAPLPHKTTAGVWWLGWPRSTPSACGDGFRMQKTARFDFEACQNIHRMGCLRCIVNQVSCKKAGIFFFLANLTRTTP